METKTNKSEVVIYKDINGPALSVQMDGETVWLSQAQMSKLFQKAPHTISEHISHIYKEKELVLEKTSFKQANINISDTGLNKPTTYYNLDVIISVGYRVKSKQGTQFRIWATKRLKDYLVQGYAINEKRLKDFENLQVKLKELESAHRLIGKALENKRLEGYEKELLRIITDYSDTWFLLNSYDKGDLDLKGVGKNPGKILPYESLIKAILKFKERLIAKKEATDLFGREVGGKFQGLLGNIGQTYGGKDLYASLEEKAAHLLYFCIKDHPFADGNKRIGALTFLLFLVENGFLYDKKGERKITDNTLTALALLIAESNPKDKDSMVKLVVNLIKQ